VSLTAINSRLKRFVPGVTRDDGWWICAAGLGAIVLAIHFYPMGFARVFHIAEGILIATTGLRLVIKGMVESWVLCLWLGLFATRLGLNLYTFIPSDSWSGSWDVLINIACAAVCLIVIARRREVRS
jgi:hypothetical protein